MTEYVTARPPVTMDWVDESVEGRVRQDSNLRPTAPEAVALSS